MSNDNAVSEPKFSLKSVKKLIVWKKLKYEGMYLFDVVNYLHFVLDHVDNVNSPSSMNLSAVSYITDGSGATHRKRYFNLFLKNVFNIKM